MKVGQPIKHSVSALLSILKRAALEPALTGPLLLFLTKAPEDLRIRVLRLLTENPYRSNPHIERSIRALKVLFTLGVIRSLNVVLNRLALNHWRVKKQGAAWDFPKEVAIVTGGSSGFGKLIAEGLAKKIKHVAVLDVNDAPDDLAASTLSSFITLRDSSTLSSAGAGNAESSPTEANISFYKCDVTNKDEVKEVAAAIRREHGVPTILINNAGIASRHNIMDTTPEQLRRIFDVNLLCHFALVQEFLPGMLQSQKGHVVTVCSVASYGGYPGLVDYCATKAGALAFHEGRPGLFTFFPALITLECSRATTCLSRPYIRAA
jgi:all-trans-retinol dehydrogenase (NAD+)